MLLRSFANFPTSAEVFRYDAAAALPDDPEFPYFCRLALISRSRHEGITEILDKLLENYGF